MLGSWLWQAPSELEHLGSLRFGDGGETGWVSAGLTRRQVRIVARSMNSAPARNRA
jgi:hypothetical protein